MSLIGCNPILFQLRRQSNIAGNSHYQDSRKYVNMNQQYLRRTKSIYNRPRSNSMVYR